MPEVVMVHLLTNVINLSFSLYIYFLFFCQWGNIGNWECKNYICYISIHRSLPNSNAKRVHYLAYKSKQKSTYVLLYYQY